MNRRPNCGMVKPPKESLRKWGQVFHFSEGVRSFVLALRSNAKMKDLTHELHEFAHEFEIQQTRKTSNEMANDF